MAARAPDPRKLAAQKRKEVHATIRWVITVDDKEFVFRLPDVNALDSGDLRRDARTAPIQMVEDALEGHVDAWAAVVWMARRQAGEVNLQWKDVAETITLNSVVYFRWEDEPEDDGEAFPDPPSSGGGSGD